MSIRNLRAVFIAAVTILTILAGTTPAMAENCVKAAPLPSDVAIVAPTPDIPAEYAAFSGVWGDARWDGELCGKLAVESITKEGDTFVARVVYSKGNSDQWHVTAGFERLSGKFVGDELRLTLTHSSGSKSWVSYKLKHGKLIGSFTVGNFTVNIKMAKLS